MRDRDIKNIVKKAKKLAKTKTEDELFEEIGKEVSKIKFQDKFKPGDIICSDRFYNGLCMVVESGGTPFKDGVRYICEDLVRENQGWFAYEFHSFLCTDPYNWRIATDDDITNYLSRFVHIPLGKVGHYKVRLLDDGIMLDDGVEDGGLILQAEELVQLGKIINERVVG